MSLKNAVIPMNRYLLSLLTFLTCVHTLSAQNENQATEILKANFKAEQVIPPMPEAASLGAYGNTPVNLSTGSVNITIPLYELKGVSLSLPISLSFNASGFRPQERATWVGQGWSLNAAGVVSRSVNGNPDDAHYYNHPEPAPVTSDFYNYMEYVSKLRAGEIEAQPDLYAYNFNGVSGKLGITPDGRIVKKTSDMINIRYSGGNFIATDLNGVRYQFDQSEQTRLVIHPEYAPEQPTVRTYDYNSSWYVSTMTSADGHEEMRFEYYKTGTYTQNVHGKSSGGASLVISNGIVVEDPEGDGTVSMRNFRNYSSELFAASDPTISSNRLFPKRLTLYRDNVAIAYVEFISDTNRDDAEFAEERVLRGIKVVSLVNGVEKVSKSLSFGYGYYYNPGLPYEQKRLRLDTIQELPIDIETSPPPPYLFEYYNDASLPASNTMGIDHWGFFNNKANTSLLPAVTLNQPDPTLPQTMGHGANREPDLTGSRFAMLKKVIYPTGGSSLYEYELHRSYNSYDNTVRNVGGVRIAAITDSTGGNVAVKRIFAYKREDGGTSGVTDGLFPKYLDESDWINMDPLIPQSGAKTLRTKTYTLTGSSIFNYGSFPGGHIGYTQVEEKRVNPATGESLGKTVYNYTFNPPYRYREDISNGELIGQFIYDSKGKLLSSTESSFTYPEKGFLTYYTVKPYAMQDNKDKYCFQEDNSYTTYLQNEDIVGTCWRAKIYLNRYYPVTGTFAEQSRRLNSVVRRLYDERTNSYHVHLTNYEYVDKHIFPVKTIESSSGGEQLVTVRKYIGDLDTSVDYGYTAMINNNLKGSEIESYQYRQTINGENQRVIAGKVMTYNTEAKPAELYRLEMSSVIPLPQFVPWSENNGIITKDSRYKPYASYFYTNGLLVTQQKTGDLPVSYVWGYNNMYPIAEVKNSNFNNIAYTSFETSEGVSGGWELTGVTYATDKGIAGESVGQLSSGSVIKKVFVVPAAQDVIVSCWTKGGSVLVTANVGNVISIPVSASRNGWNYHEFKIGAGVQQIQLSGSGMLDELKCFPATAQMFTYTFTPLKGVSAKSTPDNQQSFYEYDGLNRLFQIKDQNRNIIEHLAYAYGNNNTINQAPGTLFYSKEYRQSFTKVGTCPSGSEPGSIEYIVPAGKYVSVVSQNEADNKAVLDAVQNGQLYANVNAPCYYYSSAVSDSFKKTNCDVNIDVWITYSLPARLYRSAVSQADADAQAWQALQAEGPVYANNQGKCPCEEKGIGWKYVNGKCEQGIRIDEKSVKNPSGPGYICYYHFKFSDNTVSITYQEQSSTICQSL